MVISELSFLEEAYSLKDLTGGEVFNFEAFDFNIPIEIDLENLNSENTLIDFALLPSGVPPGSSYEGGVCSYAYFGPGYSSCSSFYRTPSGELIRVSGSTGDIEPVYAATSLP